MSSDRSTSLADLSAQEKRTLLAQLLRQKAESVTASAPLSYTQQALWFLYQTAPHNVAYNTAFTTRIRSNVDVPALRRAFQALMNRHPSLRTTFSIQENGQPVQTIHGYRDVYFEQINAAAWNQAELNERVIEAYHRPFNLEQGPVVRVHLFTSAENDHVLLLAIHHIVYDGWSLWILLDELRVLYAAEASGVPASLPPLKASYADYVREQQQMLSGPVGERLWAYWQQRLSGELPALHLPVDYPRPPVQTYNGRSHTFKLPLHLTNQLKTLAQNEGATLFALLLAAFQILLHRYTGQEDILVGSPTMGREQTKFTGVVGDFVNSVVLRANLSGNPIFRSFLQQVRQTVLEALQHQEYPFALLVEKLQPTRDPSRSPVFQVMFSLQKPQQFREVVNLLTADDQVTGVDWGGLALAPFEMAQQEGQFELVLEMVETQEALLGAFEYNTDLFAETTIASMTSHFNQLLEGIIAHPEHCLSELPILTEAERRQILIEWNDTAAEYAKEKCIHELFEEQVKRTPDVVAVVFEDQHLTYQALNLKVNQLAHQLRAKGVRPNVLVGICVERSLEMMIGLLGVLKAGGAYVPLDPTYPKERLVFMCMDAHITVLLTQKKLATELPENSGQIINLDDITDPLPEYDENPHCDATPEDLAYMIYTSGSTGTPKGVMIQHRALVNFTQAAIGEYAITSHDRVLQFASISFDAAAEEIYPCLTCGGTLVLRSPLMVSSIAAFLQACQEFGVTVLDLPTAYWHQMISEVADSRLTLPPSIRLVIIGGERAMPEKVTLWQTYIGTAPQLINTYGPTEATVVALMYPVPPPTSERSLQQEVPIGRPLHNVTAYILDPYLHPVPVGVRGELHIGGVALAKGYFNRTELTNERFIPNPFCADSTLNRLYKTGDLARYRADGNIEFLGRIDHQVKIRGFRIELGEIETVLLAHPQIKETVVIAREDQSGVKRLVAYIASAQEEALSMSDVRSYLKKRVPEYMLPSAFVILNALPVTHSGKIDRRALPDPEGIGSGTEYVAPRTPTEETLTKIWAEILSVEKVGIHDNFFELGGHSLLVTQAISRIYKAFNVHLPVHNLFEEPTIAALAESIETIRWLAQEPSAASEGTANKREEIEL